MRRLKKSYQYNKVLMQRPYRCILLHCWRLCCFILQRRIETIADCTVRISVPKECPNEPDKQHQWHYNGHYHVPDLITQVHKHANDVKGFGKGKNDDNTFEK